MEYFKNRSCWNKFRDFTASDNKNYRAIQESKKSSDIWELYAMDKDGRYSNIDTVGLKENKMIEETEEQLLKGVADAKRFLRIAHNEGDKIEAKFLAKMICKLELDIEILKMEKFLKTTKV